MALDDVHSILLNRVLVRLYEDVANINQKIHQVHAGLSSISSTATIYTLFLSLSFRQYRVTNAHLPLLS